MDIYNRIVIQLIETYNFINNDIEVVEADKALMDKPSPDKHVKEVTFVHNHMIIKLQTLLFTNAYKIVEILIQIPLICERCDIDCHDKLANIKEIVFIIISSTNYEFILIDVVKKNSINLVRARY